MAKTRKQSKYKICCYTAVTGGYDSVRDPEFVTPGVDYICFTDAVCAQSSIWRFRKIPEELQRLSLVKQQRVVKICPHRYLPEYDVSVWVDGNIRITGDLTELVDEYDLENTPFFTRIHPSRDCVYDEADAVVRRGKDSAQNVSKIVSRYKTEGYPSHAGMAETCVVVRRHNDRRCMLFDEAWAFELLLNSHRDQLSFNYVAWKTGFLPGYMSNQFRVNGNRYFRMEKHGQILI